MLQHRSLIWPKTTRNQKPRRFLLRLKAVNNVFGHKGVLVDLRRQTDQSSKEEERADSAGGEAAHRFHFEGKQHVLQVRRHLVLSGSASFLDGPDANGPSQQDIRRRGGLGETVLTNHWLGTMTSLRSVSTLNFTTSPSLSRYNSSLSGNEKQQGDVIPDPWVRRSAQKMQILKRCPEIAISSNVSF